MKILIISHNPLSDQSNMGKTLCTLFSGFGPEELCQLYIYPTVPNVGRCCSYFRITDREALRAVFSGKHPGGELLRVDDSAGMYETAVDARLYRSRRNKTALRGLLRDGMWRRSGWYSQALQHWLDIQKPEAIFVAPGGAKFLYDFALQIGSAHKLPIVTYLCDEYYFVKTPCGMLARWRQRRLKEEIEALLAKTAHLVTISPELAAGYVQRFSVPATVLMTGADISTADSAKIPEKPSVISYFGNICCNRYRSLADIGRELDAINGELDADYRLRIYTAEQDEAILSALKKHRSVEFGGFLSGEAFVQALEQAQFLLHVEAFDKTSREQVKHSVSTKIADSLASGIPLLAYGPEEVASMAHLRRNGCGISATSRKELRAMLLTAFTVPETCRKAAEHGLIAAKTFHDSNVVSRKLRDIFEDIL